MIGLRAWPLVSTWGALAVWAVVGVGVRALAPSTATHSNRGGIRSEACKCMGSW